MNTCTDTNYWQLFLKCSQCTSHTKKHFIFTSNTFKQQNHLHSHLNLTCFNPQSLPFVQTHCSVWLHPSACRPGCVSCLTTSVGPSSCVPSVSVSLLQSSNKIIYVSMIQFINRFTILRLVNQVAQSLILNQEAISASCADYNFVLY